MREVLVAGAGKIGILVAVLLAMSEQYRVHVADIKPELLDWLPIDKKVSRISHISVDFSNPEGARSTLSAYIRQKQITTVISCLPFFCNPLVAQIAKENALNYFDLTEDTKVTEFIKSLAIGAKTAFVPQCGLAPGFVSIMAGDLMKNFDRVDTLLMRVGALPVYPNNALKYALTWSTEGMINQYSNICYGIVNGKEVPLQPLEGLETIQIDGLLYEAFNTSGGLGSMADTYDGKVNTMNYKSLRYPGHCRKMRFLMNDLKLSQDRSTLKNILENAIAKTYQDVVLIYIAVKGYKKDELIEETYVKKVYPNVIAGKLWSAIQITTAASACAVLDIVLGDPKTYQGMVLQEFIPLKDFLHNPFGQYYQ